MMMIGLVARTQKKWGAWAAGPLWLAVRQTLRHTVPRLIGRLGRSLCGELSGGPPDSTRGPRVVPIQRRRHDLVRTHSRRHPIAGVSLIECLVYIAVVSVVMGCGFMALYRGMDNHKNLRRNADDIMAAVNTGELWRKDVRAATGRIKSEAHEQTQTLVIPQAHGAVAYQFADGELRRQGRADGPWVVALPRVQSSSMTADPRERVSAWRWELTLKSTAREARVKPVFTFEAIPGFKQP